MAYHVRNWDRHYETNKTRILKTMSWLALPVALDSDGYAELIDHQNGAAHFGIFVALLEVAARCQPRGCLLRARKVPHDALSLARVCRIPASLMQEAVERLVSVGWIETCHHEGTTGAREGQGMDDTLQDPTNKTQPTKHTEQDPTQQPEPPTAKAGDESGEEPPGSPSTGATGLPMREIRSALKEMPKIHRGTAATERLKAAAKKRLQEAE